MVGMDKKVKYNVDKFYYENHRVSKNGTDATLKHITPEGLTAIRSYRGKKAWAKKKALATA